MSKVHNKNSQRLYESNYRKLMAMLPDISVFNHITLSSDDHLINVSVEVVERTPYTTLLALQSNVRTASLFAPETRLQVRLYHDAHLAEVVVVQGIRRINSYNIYPNEKMHLPDEKRQGNRLLAEILSFCHCNDYKKTYLPRPIEINQ